MLLQKLKESIRRERDASGLLVIEKKIKVIRERMKKAPGDKVQALADEMEALEIERDAIIERLIRCGADPGIETRG